MSAIDERLAYVVQGPATVIVGRDDMRALLEKVKRAETLVTEDESYSRNLRDALNRAVRAEARGNELQREFDNMSAMYKVADIRLQQVQDAYQRHLEATAKLVHDNADANNLLQRIIADLRAEVRYYAPTEPVAGLVTTF